MTLKRSVIIGTGSYLPERILSNKDLAEQVDTTDEWIIQRTGIQQRHIAADEEYTSDLATKAAQNALDNAGMKPEDIDLIILATATPDYTFPSTAVSVQHNLGITQGAAFDVQAVCSGFIFALSTADTYILSGKARNVLVIGAETFSRILDWEDRTTCVLFGDGAGAVVVQAQDYDPAKPETDRGILTTQLRSDGSHIDKLYVDGGPSRTQSTGHLRMKGRDVFKHAVGMVTDVIEMSYAATNLSSDDIKWFIPHQANQRIIDASAKKMGIDEEKVIKTVSGHANTSAASIPLAIDTANRENKLKKHDIILLEAMGGGFTWGAIILKW